VDSPPTKERNDEFVNVTHLLAAEGLHVPHIYYSSLDFGFFLLSDFGDTQLLHKLNKENATQLYTRALDTLQIIQNTDTANLPLYSEKLLLQEMELFREWYLKQHLSIQPSMSENQLMDECINALANSALQQPQVFVHRDYHSRNLMMLEDGQLGIIDYQDAVRGPVTYDLVSLLRDCYINWPETVIDELTKYFYQKHIENTPTSDGDYECYKKWFDLMGIQRHLKAIGIFSRLKHRDNKPTYMDDIPRTLDYVCAIGGRYPETSTFVDFLNSKVIR